MLSGKLDLTWIFAIIAAWWIGITCLGADVWSWFG